MTVTYSLDASSSRLFTFGKLLFRWRGSVFKLLWRETLAFLVLYYALSFTYRFALDDAQKRLFERFCRYCDQYMQYAPLSFVLGFFLSIVYSRWWSQFEAITWPDKMAIFVCTYVRGNDYRGRLIRRTVMRYLNLASVLGFRIVSSAVLKRFPSPLHLVEAGFITESELEIFNHLVTPHPRYWLPCQWAANLLYAARQEGRIGNDRELLELVKEVNNFNFRIKKMTSFNWISVPIAYTQVLTIAVYSYFLACLFGKQFLDSAATGGQSRDVYFPLFTIIQLAFYMGWMKVAEVLINPFGEDDDDFEVNFIVERNLQLSYNIVDDAYGVQPPLEQDIHWNEHDPHLPHTVASIGLKDHGYFGSTLDIKIPPEQTDVLVDKSDEETSHSGSSRPHLHRMTSAIKGSTKSIHESPKVHRRQMTRKRLTSYNEEAEQAKPMRRNFSAHSHMSSETFEIMHRYGASSHGLLHERTAGDELDRRGSFTGQKSHVSFELPATSMESLAEASGENGGEKHLLLGSPHANAAGKHGLGVIREDPGSRSPSKLSLNL